MNLLLRSILVSFSFALACASQSLTAEPTRVVLVGDSTVASGSGWGDGFLKLFEPDIESINMALRGRSSKSYRDEGHWKKVLEAKPTWVLIQFGHNDQPGKGSERETDPETSFRQNLTRFIDEARRIGAKPVLVTSLPRRNFNAEGRIKPDLLIPYVEATRAVADEKSVPLVELYARSVELMNRVGPEAAVAYDAKGKDSRPDRTHLSPFGERETAILVAEEIRKVAPGLAELLKP